ncbi:unnamed protein product, partial [Rotaria magnacalcarata]
SFRKTKKKPGSNPAGGKGGIAPASGSEKGTSAATGITAAAVAAGGKTSARPTLISARGPPVSDRSNPKTEVATNEENEKYD